MAYKLVTKIWRSSGSDHLTIHDRVCPGGGHYLDSLCLDFLTVIVWGENSLKGLELLD